MSSPRTLRIASTVTMAVIATSVFAFGREEPAPLPGAPTNAVPPPAAPPAVDLAGRDLEGLRFVDITSRAGLDRAHISRDLEGAEVQTGGAAVADFDNDGDMDVFLTRVGLPNLLYANQGDGTFTEIAEAAGVGGARPSEGSSGASFADYDGDGWLDLLVDGNRSGPSQLFRNLGDGTFADTTEAAGIVLPDLRENEFNVGYSSAFADWDHDGDLDLLSLQWYKDRLALPPARAGLTNDDLPSMCDRSAAARFDITSDPAAPSSRTRLWRNDGDGTFTDVTSVSGVETSHLAGFTPTFTDVDGDGWEDLLIAGDYCTSRVYMNDRGRAFVDRTEGSGAATDENGMGSAVADLDGDGLLDWFVSGISYPTEAGGCPIQASAIACSGNRLFLGNSDGTFRDATDQFAVRGAHWGWGAAAADLDNDGNLDLVVGNGYREGRRSRATDQDSDQLWDWFDDDPTSVWLGGGPGPWPDVAKAVGLSDTVNTKAVIAFDVDGDGDLDLLLANTETPPILYRNDLPQRRHWLTLRLEQAGPNPRGIGARVRVDADGDGRSTPMEVRASGTFQGSAPTDLHIGLGDADRLARLEIWWPGATEPQVLTDVVPDRTLTVTRPT